MDNKHKNTNINIDIITNIKCYIYSFQAQLYIILELNLINNLN